MMIVINAIATRMLAGITILTATIGAAEPEQVDNKVEAAVRANSGFAIDLYRQLCKKRPDENLFFSPFSISNGLAIAAEGARGETAGEMHKVLHFPTGRAEMSEGMAKLNHLVNAKQEETAENKELRLKIEALKTRLAETRAEIKAMGYGFAPIPLQRREHEIVAELNKLAPQLGGYDLEIANALWGEQSFPFLDDFQKAIAKTHGHAALQSADFKNSPEKERLRINRWVADRTQNKIQNLLPPGLNKDCRLVITNAIYFRGSWLKPFSASSTGPLDFFRSPAETIKTPTMAARSWKDVRYGAFEADGQWFETPDRYLEGEEPPFYPGEAGFEILELPYQGDHLSMVVLAPRKIDGLAAIEKQLSADGLHEWLGKLRKRKTHIYLPKFEVSATYGLSDSLRSLGMNRAFDDPRKSGGADFSAMTKTTQIEGVYLNDVLHRASISVDEKGTKAYAATSKFFEMPMSLKPRYIDFTPTFRADRPFLFLIRDKRSGNILFLGRITQP